MNERNARLRSNCKFSTVGGGGEQRQHATAVVVVVVVFENVVDTMTTTIFCAGEANRPENANKGGEIMVCGSPPLHFTYVWISLWFGYYLFRENLRKNDLGYNIPG
ncbi:unnamed protein product [Ectocarpus sp. 8 AP-2014]